jgi:hypothetical protein
MYEPMVQEPAEPGAAPDFSEAVSCDPAKLAGINPMTGELHLRIPVEGDLFVPLYAYNGTSNLAHIAARSCNAVMHQARSLEKRQTSPNPSPKTQNARSKKAGASNIVADFVIRG